MTARVQVGAKLTIEGQPWEIVHLTVTGQVALVSSRGEFREGHIVDMLRAASADRISDVRLGSYDRLTREQQEPILRRQDHIREVITGYRSGTSSHPRPGEPKIEYDPDQTTRTQRIANKAAELDHDGYRASGETMAEITVRRMVDHYLELGIDGLVDRRSLSSRPKRKVMTPLVAEVLDTLIDERATKSTINFRTLHRMLCDQLMQRDPVLYSTPRKCPSYSSVKVWFREHYKPSDLSGAAKYRSTKKDPTSGFFRRTPTRPGEMVVADTSGLDVRLRTAGDEGTTSGVLIICVDWYSRSIVGLRVLEKSESAIDITSELVDLARPTAMRPHWSHDARWPYVGVPEEAILNIVDQDQYKHGIAGIPMMRLESFTPDHGSTYKAKVNIRAAESLGISIVPARLGTPTDKALVERVFGAIRSMVLEHIDGYRGRNPGERGRDTDADALFTAQELEELLLRWVAEVWQFHTLDAVRPPWCPNGTWSPNALIEAAMASTGLTVNVPTLNDYLRTRPSTYVKVTSRGVKVAKLHFDAPELNTMRNTPSPIAGARKGKYEVRYDPRDMRKVWLHHPKTLEFIELTWTGMAHAADLPPFTDRHLAAIKREVKAADLALTDAEVLPRLLTLLKEETQAATGRRAGASASRSQQDASKRSAEAERAKTERERAGSTAMGPREPSPPVRGEDITAARKAALADQVPAHSEAGRFTLTADLVPTYDFNDDEDHS
jgi:hypothetical protein